MDERDVKNRMEIRSQVDIKIATIDLISINWLAALFYDVNYSIKINRNLKL